MTTCRTWSGGTHNLPALHAIDEDRVVSGSGAQLVLILIGPNTCRFKMMLRSIKPRRYGQGTSKAQVLCCGVSVADVAVLYIRGWVEDFLSNSVDITDNLPSGMMRLICLHSFVAICPASLD